MLSEKDSFAGVNVPVCVGDVEKIGKSLLPRAALDYYKSGAGEEVTLSMNREAFRREENTEKYVLIPSDPKSLSCSSEGAVTHLGKKNPLVQSTPTEFHGIVLRININTFPMLPPKTLGGLSVALCPNWVGISHLNIEFRIYRLRIRPRILRDVSRRDLTSTVLGKRVAVPFGVSPTAMHRMAHPDGEVATARGKLNQQITGMTEAAEKVGAVFILSTLSTSSLEEVAEGAPNATKWFQLYIYKKRDLTRDLVARAEKLGYEALVLTVDAPVFGIRWADARNKFSLPPHLRLANFIGSDESQGVRNRGKKGSQLQAYVTELFDQSLTWKDIGWLKSVTKLPLILKGILTKEDTEEALKYDVAGIMVSNHGARQVDGFPATIEALPEILKAVNNRCDVYLDGGVTQGTDVFKALALGAKMVFVGRPAIWGLAYNGEDGVKSVLEFIKNELDFTMALTGCATLEDIKPEMVVPASYYSLL
ncbi:hypothetical protein J437_LFUL007246 [Ladona fulva]|uniref:(S)-2-hydroxy-acid oxidase n=1 Tax=Ladona fulva TaxID=123851 RepID=A0A8K0JXV3_LADFU|nr:hypothetical protein J437_LFUL007246 [Ladona fulva]